MRDTPLPVTLVTGFLGAGKTTFLNHLLSSDHGEKLGVIVNEFDELGIDQDLIENTRGQLVGMNNGCLCCTVQGDLKPMILAMLEADPTLSGLVIETTGLANPGHIAAAFFADPLLCEATRLDAIVTLVDAVNLKQHLDPTHPDSVPFAQVAHADRILINKCDLVTEAELERLSVDLRAINPLAAQYRTVRGVLSVREVLDVHAYDFEHRFEEGFADDHHHEEDISSVSFQTTGDFDQIQLNTYFCNLLREQGEQIYRCKGVVNVAQLDEPLLFQGVSTLFATAPGKPWPPTGPRVTRAVFIGTGLDRASLEAGFMACRLEPAPRPG